MNGEKVISKNMAAVQQIYDKAFALTDGQIDEAVHCLLSDGTVPDPQHAAEFFTKAFHIKLLSGEFATLCRALYKKDDTQYHNPASENARIAYIPNGYSQAALDTFISTLPGAHPETTVDFRAACEAVFSERAEYCLLPVCSTSDGQFQAFRRLMKSNELKICSKCNVFLPENDNEMQFALLSRNCFLNNSTQYIDFSFVPADTDVIPSMCSAVSAFESAVSSIYSTPLEYNIKTSEFTFTVKLRSGAAEPFIQFLDAALPGHSIDGAYCNISESERNAIND